MLVGFDTNDDAGVYLLSPEMAQLPQAARCYPDLVTGSGVATADVPEDSRARARDSVNGADDRRFSAAVSGSGRMRRRR